MKYLSLAISMLVGCVTVSHDITIESTKPFEGRFDSKNELEQAVSKIELTDGESVWILTNGTLKRLLKNASGK